MASIAGGARVAHRGTPRSSSLGILLVVLPCVTVVALGVLGALIVMPVPAAPEPFALSRGSGSGGSPGRPQRNRLGGGTSAGGLEGAPLSLCPTPSPCVAQPPFGAEEGGLDTLPPACDAPASSQPAVGEGSGEDLGETPAAQFGPVRGTESWRRFGELTPHARQCNAGFGFDLVTAWRSRGQVWCGKRGDADPKSLGGVFTSAAFSPEVEEGAKQSDTPLGPTRFACFKTRQHRHTGDDNFCAAEGVAIDTSMLARQKKEPHIFLFPPGTMQGTCSPRKDLWTAQAFTMWHAGWFQSYKQAQGSLQCDTVVEETVVFVSRDNWKHLYWQTAAFFNLFVMYNVAGVQPDSVRIVMLDYWPLGPFEAVMQKAFSNPDWPITTLEELGKQAGPRVCFRRALFSLPEYSAAIVKGRPNGDDCSNSELVRAYASHVATRLGAVRSALDDSKNNRPVKVVFNSRRNYDGRTLLRQLANEQQLVDGLKARHGSVLVEQVDFAKLSFEQQILKASEADVMVGMHGSGLAHCMFMQEDGILIEITEARGNLKTFRNLCKWAGKTYIAFPFTTQGQGGVRADEQAFSRVMDTSILIAGSYYNRVITAANSVA